MPLDSPCFRESYPIAHEISHLYVIWRIPPGDRLEVGARSFDQDWRYGLVRGGLELPSSVEQLLFSPHDGVLDRAPLQAEASEDGDVLFSLRASRRVVSDERPVVSFDVLLCPAREDIVALQLSAGGVKHDLYALIRLAT